MKEYEIACTYLNGCAGAAYPQNSFEEAELTNTDDYIRSKHRKEFDQFQKEVLPNGQIVYKFSNGAVTYIYEFTEI
jgi:trehalose/maltose hydrolase-like predicted phosphorylase